MVVRFRLPTDDPWFATTWEGSRLARLIEAANWPMAQKLAWLEEAAELATHLRGQHPSSPPESAKDEPSRPR